MGCMLVNQRLSRVSEQEFRYDQQSDVFLAIEGFLEYVAAVAVCGELDDTSPA